MVPEEFSFKSKNNKKNQGINSFDKPFFSSLPCAIQMRNNGSCMKDGACELWMCILTERHEASEAQLRGLKVF